MGSRDGSGLRVLQVSSFLRMEKCFRISFLLPFLLGGCGNGGSSNDIVANYMYLIEFPLGENLTRFMPDPPFHLFVFLPIAILLFFITYLPFYLKDRFFSQ